MTGCRLSKDTAESNIPTEQADFIIAFGSGNKQFKKNPFWEDIENQKPDLWIWGGDNIYCDTEDSLTLVKCYEKQLSQPEYVNFIHKIRVIGVWDDHDYGLNDGGVEHRAKQMSKNLFLNFMKAPTDDPRRHREGVYRYFDYKKENLTIRVILLDLRSFRTSLTKSDEPGKRYSPNPYGKGTMLGEAQWKWLEKVLYGSSADYNIIVSGIQFLSDKHGYESWGNMPHERDKLEHLIESSAANNVLILSGDRHISEISEKKLPHGKKLIDFTSSGLTHAYTSFSGEENPYRVSPVIHRKSYGILRLGYHKIIMEMWGEHHALLFRKEMSK